MKVLNQMLSAAVILTTTTYIFAAEKVVTVERSMPAFSTLSINGDFNVLVKKSNKPHIFITTETAAISEVVTEVHNGELDVHYKKSGFSFNPPKVHLTLYLPSYSAISITGAVNAVCDDLNISKMSVGISGASSLRLSGRVNELNVSMMGNSKLDTNALEAQVIKLITKGNNYAKLNITNATFMLSAAGNNTILYKGRPVRMVNNSMGNNQIRPQ